MKKITIGGEQCTMNKSETIATGKIKTDNKRLIRYRVVYFKEDGRWEGRVNIVSGNIDWVARHTYAN